MKKPPESVRAVITELPTTGCPPCRSRESRLRRSGEQQIEGHGGRLTRPSLTLPAEPPGEPVGRLPHSRPLIKATPLAQQRAASGRT